MCAPAESVSSEPSPERKIQGRQERPRDLSAAELEAMLAELLALYAQPAFQAELAAAYTSAHDMGSGLCAMNSAVLRVQAPVFRRFGLPLGDSGRDLMDDMVQRRVAEGAGRVEDLANQTRRALGIEGLPNRAQSAEAVLAGKAEEVARMPQDHLLRQCRKKLAEGQRQGLLTPIAAGYLASLIAEGVPAPAVLSLIRMACLGTPLACLRGEGSPGAVPVIQALPPDGFWQAYVLPHRPVLLRGALDAQRFPPLELFREFAHLRRRCGHRRVHVKGLAYDDRTGRRVFVSDPDMTMPLADYLDCVEAHERDGSTMACYLGKVPLQSDLPELLEDVQAAETCPARLYGSCFGELAPQGVYTYLGCGRNTTSIHFDRDENLLTCLYGTKRLWLYPPSDARYLRPALNASRSSAIPFARLEELPDSIQRRLGQAAEAWPREVILRPADILYLPLGWWHCVEGSEDRNMVLSYWFRPHPSKREA